MEETPVKIVINVLERAIIFLKKLLNAFLKETLTLPYMIIFDTFPEP